MLELYKTKEGDMQLSLFLIFFLELQIMSFQSNNNKRIAKNTLLLYFRMLFMMVVSLYTNRVIFNAFGQGLS
jgi:hypothetical protein